MMSEQQYLWAPTPDKPKRGRVWLIVALAVAAVAIVAVLLWAFLRPGSPAAEPASTTSASPSASTSPPTSASPSASASPTSDPTPTQTPITSPPPIPDPDLGAFREQVSGWLNDALTGLDIVSESSGQDARAVIGNLQDDAQRLAESIPPSSISSKWSDGVAAYSRRLSDLNKAVSSGTAPPVDAARTAVTNLRTLAGM
jgi:cytoskeletal protein RodZ